MNSKQQLIDYWQKDKIITDKNLLKAFAIVDREKFILPEYLEEAYDDNPLPILGGQTISQPTTVMMMIQALELKKKDKILEIGAGSGYNAAIMSKLCKKIYSVEIVEELADFARKNLKNAGIKNVEVISGDGSLGYEKFAPYDKCMITAACPEIPETIIAQMKINGIILAPVGVTGAGYQELIKAKKTRKGLESESLGEFSFVPMKGKYGF
ncbi:TPA: protein-L-isoaspartate(D-aspartate) O-methyltransferase [Candidatus Woesearchaeota archaeon]|nr:protein-L-isoaspartate(D-aspartate) O-methyltransferase [Candidatus Woesearchaeota archaeon]